ncbi:flagellar assembly protein FliH [Gottfriedia luciferensis]|uniref:flagellar assembly protein FliH n=1 Tax=Gottfriedia luciferensis TaxID=178774 RepID=UPI00130230A5|nr:flagellar assembly protein FliH [Gottfriedia luciferensis]
MSNLIKSQHVKTDSTPFKTIGIQRLFVKAEEIEEMKIEADQLKFVKDEILTYEKQLVQLKEQIQTMRSEALTEIENMKQNWFDEKRDLIELAKEEGILQGKEEGRQIAVQEYESLIMEAKEVVKASKVDYLNRIEESEEAILKLGLAVSRHILLHEIELNQELMIPIIKKVLQEVKEENDIRISVHPGQYDLVVKQRVELEKILLNDIKLYVYPDESLTLGSCIIDSSFGRIDASVDVQLSEISRHLIQLSQEEEDGAK